MGLTGLDRVEFPTRRGYVYDPSTTGLRFRTSEYSFTFRVSDQGLRNPHVEVPKPAGVYRVLALGDSFTYGWGVAEEEAWPRRLEGILRERTGRAVEVVNAGMAGAEPRHAAEIAERAAGDLQPDLVVVCFLQAEDLIQLKYAYSGFLGPTKAPGLLGALHAWLPGLVDAIQRRRTFDAGLPASNRAGGRELSSSYPEAFARLPQEVQDALLAGDLNPGPVWLALRHPDAYSWACDPKAAHDSLEIVRGCLQRIRAAASAPVLVVSCPTKAYVSAPLQAQAARLGFEVGPELLETHAVDEVLAAAVARVGLAFCAPLDAFRAHAASDLYFSLDDHFRPAGHDLLAHEVASEVLRRGWLAAR